MSETENKPVESVEPTEPTQPTEPVAADTTAPAAADSKETPSALTQLWEAAKTSGHPEVWGVTLTDPASHIPSQIVFQKYLNANDGDVIKAKDQLLKTLEWRAKMNPLELMKKAFNKEKFEGLGFVTTYSADDAASQDPEKKEVFTWNVYGGAKSIVDTFGNLNEFIEWRVALMELALQELGLTSATSPITADNDPYKMIQVHDYKSISFLRAPPQVKTASTETIRVFAQNYPELLREKFFINVPAIMGFMYALMKLFVAPKTIRKFHPMSNGANLVNEFPAAGGNGHIPGLGEKLPPEYGGKGADLKTQGKGAAYRGS